MTKTNTEILREIFKFLKTRVDDWDAMALDYIPEGSSNSTGY